MKTYSLQAIVDHARAHSPFYGHLFEGLPNSIASVELLPIVDQVAYWSANNLVSNRLLSGPVGDGIIFRSGGTTGDPKYSVFSKEEWSTFTEIFGQGMVAGGLQGSERIANLFYGGGLYASFLFIHGALEKAAIGTVELPLGGITDPDEVIRVSKEFNVTTWAGVPTLLLSLVRHLQTLPSTNNLPLLKKILYGGESMYPDQIEYIRSVIPGVKIQSIGYASVDAGLLGYADCRDPDGVHRVFKDATIIEIVDEATGRPIEDPHVSGRLVVTNLTRRLMPVIRYPAGDCAEWMDPPVADGELETGRRFRLTGRSDEAARVGPVSIYFGDVERLIHQVLGKIRLFGFQLILTHHNHCDHLTVRVAADCAPSHNETHTRTLLSLLYGERKMLAEWLAQGKVGPVNVEWVSPEGLEQNQRTGKQRRIIDRRLKQ